MDFMEMSRVSRKGLLVGYAPTFGANALQLLLFGVKRRFEGDTSSRVIPGPFAAALAASLPRHRVPSASSTPWSKTSFSMTIVPHRLPRRPAVSHLTDKARSLLGLTPWVKTSSLTLAQRSVGAQLSRGAAP